MNSFPLPEWAPHQAVWIGFPSAADLWEADLAPAQAEVAAFAEAVHANGAGEQVWLVAADETAASEARRLAPFAKVIVEPFGDIWLRDTGAIILGTGTDRRAQGFGFNGWGGKYDLPDDATVGDDVADHVMVAVQVDQRLLQVEDVDPVTFGEDVGAHLRVPLGRAVTKVDARFQKRLHGNLRRHCV